ncbi:MAG: serine acetyltransferase [Deinococcota bacterium]
MDDGLPPALNQALNQAETNTLTREFLEQLYHHHQTVDRYPPSAQVCDFAERLLHALFPEQTNECIGSLACLEAEFAQLEASLVRVLSPLSGKLVDAPQTVAAAFMRCVPNIYHHLLQDAQAMLAGDPAATSLYEVIRAYPGFYATAMYRMAHVLWQQQVPLLPRLITEHAHSKTGIDIHPGARIGSHFCIDHGTGIVIGETTVVGSHVKLYQGVTLGALSVSKDLAGSKRHPTLEDDVVIYAGATILGGNTVIGTGSMIGGSVWLTHSVPAGSRVYYEAGSHMREAVV